MFLTDLPYATLANDPGQTEEQHRTPDVQKTPDHQNAISFLQKVSPHEHSFNPTKLDHFPPPRVHLVLLLHPLLDLEHIQ